MGHRTFWKDPKGTARKAWRRAAGSVRYLEIKNKVEVRARDRGCRWPWCDCRLRRVPTEVAHLEAKKIGGDHGLRSEPWNLIELCRDAHQGVRSLHSGHRKVWPLTDAGTNGPCEFFERDSLEEAFRSVGKEISVGILDLGA